MDNKLLYVTGFENMFGTDKLVCSVCPPYMLISIYGISSMLSPLAKVEIGFSSDLVNIF